EGQALGRRIHARGEVVDDLVRAPVEEACGQPHVLRVVLLRDPSYARRGTALDLVQQTGARAVLEHRVLAGTQAEDLLQQVDALPRRAAVRERPEVARAARERAAVVGQAREIV